jgi:CSLREA domain-containing protein
MRSHPANSRFSAKPSRKQLATRKRLTLALISLLALAFAGFPALHRAEFSRRVGAQNPTVAPSIKFDIVVNSTGDLPDANPNDGLCDDGNGRCTLRAAIENANAAAGDDVISFNIPTGDPGCTAGVCTINLGLGGYLFLSTNITIIGPGADKLTVRGSNSAGLNSSVFVVGIVGTTITVTFSGMTISNGNNVVGGGIQIGGATVNFNDCIISDNFAASGGGIAVVQGSTVNVTRSTLNNNTTNQGGAGIYIDSSSTANVTNSTITGNSTHAIGGGIHNNMGTVNITNSTINNNFADYGGGIGGGGTVNITDSTISSNSASTEGGGVYTDTGGTANIKSSIIALNNSNFSPDVSGAGTYQSAGFNLIRKNVGAATSFPAGNPNMNNDIVGTGAGIDPKLDPAGLKNNGGPTQTIALLPGSPAIDKGTRTGNLTNDQRGSGFPRTVNDPLIANATGGDGTDIGAFEKQTVTATLQFSSATYSVNENAGAATITVTRANDTSVAATVNYATSNGTATAGADYTATSGTLSFASGDTSKTFSIPITNDSFNEPNETVNLTLSNVTGNAALGPPSTAVLTIIDDDPLPGLSINDVSVAEGNSGTTNANFTVSLSAASGQTVAVNYATANGTGRRAATMSRLPAR